MECPNCSVTLRELGACPCGWRKDPQEQGLDPNRDRCAYTEKGDRCTSAGTMSFGTRSSKKGVKSPFYCSKHYRKLTP